MAISIWLLNNHISQKYFLISLAATFLFITLDVWWQFFFNYDFFGNPRYSFTLKDLLVLLEITLCLEFLWLDIYFFFCILDILLNIFKRQSKNTSFIFLILLLGTLSIYITGERMALIIFISGASLVSIGLFFNTRKLENIYILVYF